MNLPTEISSAVTSGLIVEPQSRETRLRKNSHRQNETTRKRRRNALLRILRTIVTGHSFFFVVLFLALAIFMHKRSGPDSAVPARALKQSRRTFSTKDDPLFVLKSVFGYDCFLDGQRDAIRRVLDRKNCIVIFPTGGGKSLCYQLPALMFEGLTLVISPLIALMKDQVDSLRSRNIAADFIDSDQALEEVYATWNRLRSKQTKLLFVTPERFANESFLLGIKSLDVMLVAVDEAHCISQWGYSFRPDYLRLRSVVKDLFPNARFLGLTATATPQVTLEMAEQFHVAPSDVIQTTFHRPNLYLKCTVVDEAEKFSVLLDRLHSRPRGPTIIYCTRQEDANSVALELRHGQWPARAYHAGMKGDARKETQEWFMQPSNDTGIICATIAFGMGIDKPNIRYVYHYCLSKSLETYAQEIGRAGRDGKEAICETLLCNDDVPLLESFAYNETPSLHAVKNLLRDLLFDGNTVFHGGYVREFSMWQLANVHDMNEQTVKILLVHLELTGRYFTALTPRWNHFKYVPFSRFNAAEVALRSPAMAAIVLHGVRAAKFTHLDVTSASASSGLDRHLMVEALSSLEWEGLIELKCEGLTHRLRIEAAAASLASPGELKRVAAAEFLRMQQREEAELGRLKRMINLLKSTRQCATATLCNYFGELNPAQWKCGHCFVCGEKNELEDAKRESFQPTAALVDASAWEKFKKATLEGAFVRDDQRLLVRVALGKIRHVFS